jgi:hypothetical protein
MMASKDVKTQWRENNKKVEAFRAPEPPGTTARPTHQCEDFSKYGTANFASMMVVREPIGELAGLNSQACQRPAFAKAFAAPLFRRWRRCRCCRVPHLTVQSGRMLGSNSGRDIAQ